VNYGKNCVNREKNVRNGNYENREKSERNENYEKNEKNESRERNAYIPAIGRELL